MCLLIIRFSNNIKEDVNLAKEKFVIDVLAGKGIPVPKIYAFHFPEKKEEGYMIMEFIEGERLDKNLTSRFLLFFDLHSQKPENCLFFIASIASGVNTNSW